MGKANAEDEEAEEDEEADEDNEVENGVEENTESYKLPVNRKGFRITKIRLSKHLNFIRSSYLSPRV